MGEKITPYDTRIQNKTANLNGVTYSYILAEPKGQPVNTIFLIHGWPDISFGWRYQIHYLLSLNFRVVAPDMMGYGGTDAPTPLSYYTYKRSASDIAALASHLGLSSIILGGHDWGGAIVFRIAMYYPKLISAVISVCTPFTPPKTTYVPATVLPNFKYQLQLQGPEVEANIVGEEKLRGFLNGMFGGRTPSGDVGFSIHGGVIFDQISKVGPSPLLTENEMDFYVKRYALHGMRGPLNWYRTGELNWEDEKELAAEIEKDGYQFEMPILFVGAKKDAALPPKLSRGLEKWCKNLTRREVYAGHWALWEATDSVNKCFGEFLEQIGTLKANL